MTDKLKPCPFCGKTDPELVSYKFYPLDPPRIEALEAVARAASVYRRGESTAVDLFDAVDALDKLEVA